MTNKLTKLLTGRMSLKKFLTEEPGNVIELLEYYKKISPKLAELVKVTYKSESPEMFDGLTNGVNMKITYELGRKKITKNYGWIVDFLLTNEDSSISKKLRKESKKDLETIQKEGFNYQESYDLATESIWE